MRVLLMEDDPGIAAAVKAGLEREEFVVDVAADGITGQWMATENPYDVMVFDIMLPGRNGYDVLQNVRAAGVWTPVMMLTAKDGEYDQVDAFELGADDYLTKPFSLVVLVARLRSLARRSVAARPVALTVGDLYVDPTKHIARRGDVEIPLTAKEFALLVYLAQHADEPVTKAEILDNVWGSDFEGGDNVVEVYVGYLRKKVDVPFGVATIVTVRGVGYKLTAPTAS